MAVIASAAATLLHEGIGHGAIAWFRGDVPTQLTSNHLSTMRPDRWVDAAGTLVNLFAGAVSLLASRAAGNRANLRYFLWILAALNVLPGAGYFLFSGIFGFGDWEEVIRGLPHQVALRTGMTIFGAALYIFVGAPPRSGSEAVLFKSSDLQRCRTGTLLCCLLLQLRGQRPRSAGAEAVSCLHRSCRVRRVLRPAVGGQSTSA